MATVPDTHTFTGGVATSSEANSFIRDPLSFLLNPPIAELRQSVAQTFTTAVSAAVTFNAHDVDEDYTGGNPGHDDVTQNTRYTARYSGWFLVSGAVVFVANATGDRFAWLQINGTDVNASLGFVAGDATAASAVPCRTKLVFLNVGDYIELIGHQTSGGNLNSDAGGRNQSSMTIRWVSN